MHTDIIGCDLFLSVRRATKISTLSLHDALPIFTEGARQPIESVDQVRETELLAAGRHGDSIRCRRRLPLDHGMRSEEHTSELQSRLQLVCRLLLEKKKHAIVVT